MKKIIYSILLAGLVALGLSSCSNGNKPDKGIPVIHEVFYTDHLANVFEPNLSNMKRLDQITVNRTSSPTFDYNYSLVVDFSDEDLDVVKMHTSYDGFEKNDEIYNIKQDWADQYSWWNKQAWKMPNDSTELTLSVYLEDDLGNRSDIKTFTVKTVFGD